MPFASNYLDMIVAILSAKLLHIIFFDQISLPTPLKLHQRINPGQYIHAKPLENLFRIVHVAEFITFASLSLTDILKKDVMVAWFLIMLRGNAQLPAAANVGLLHNSEAYDN